MGPPFERLLPLRPAGDRSPAPPRRAPGRPRELCCLGREAVARTIAAAGLESYYETRSASAAPPAALPSIENIDDAVHGAGTEAALIIDRVRCAACLWLVEQTLRRFPA